MKFEAQTILKIKKNKKIIKEKKKKKKRKKKLKKKKKKKKKKPKYYKSTTQSIIRGKWGNHVLGMYSPWVSNIHAKNLLLQ